MFKKTKFDSEINPGIIVRGRIGTRIYQKTSATFVNAGTTGDPQRQIRTEPPRNDPNTPQQQDQRAQLTLAVARWQQLTPAERTIWNRNRVGKYHYHRDNGKVGYFSGYTYFLSNELQNRAKARKMEDYRQASLLPRL